MRRRAPLRCASLPGLLLDALLLAALLLASGCGKKGPPQAPIRILPGPAREARVRQVGPDVVLTALLPDRKTDGTPLESGTQVRVLRMPATATLRPGLVSARYLERQFEREAKVVASFAIDGKKGLPPGGRLRFRDPAPMAAAVARGPVRHLYGILVVGADGKRSGLTPPLEIEVQPPPGSAANLKLETAEGEVRLAWDPPAGHEAPPARPSAPPLLYNVYRRTATEGEEPDAPLNPQPLKETKFVDRSFRYGEVYRYSIRVLVSPGPPLRESVATPEAEVRPVDVYAAAAPTGLAVSLEGGVIKVYWFPNS
ncbi:MAG TPA: hypothetical protein VFT43_10705, partial [Candidatus Polarisedimenticolia bacterium]|nr:hypothetical protein [Candidatus Polarisedimenticolia bacterium]